MLMGLIIVVHTDHPDLETSNVTPLRNQGFYLWEQMKDLVHKQRVEHAQCIAMSHILDAAYHIKDNHKAVTMMHWIYIHAKVCEM